MRSDSDIAPGFALSFCVLLIEFVLSTQCVLNPAYPADFPRHRARTRRGLAEYQEFAPRAIQPQALAHLNHRRDRTEVAPGHEKNVTWSFNSRYDCTRHGCYARAAAKATTSSKGRDTGRAWRASVARGGGAALRSDFGRRDRDVYRPWLQRYEHRGDRIGRADRKADALSSVF